ncbi:MAG: VOC family protein [Chloroflexota bacterium]|jgi:predicted enzyme related to lactoylglutathione lyase
MKYAFTRLLVTNFKDCFRFYRDVMGFQPGFGTENDTYADFLVGETNISLFDKNEMSQALGTLDKPVRPDSQDHVCLTFGVDNVDEFYKSLVEKGVNVPVPPTDHPDWSIRTVHFRDPDGNLIEVNQNLPQT